MPVTAVVLTIFGLGFVVGALTMESATQTNPGLHEHAVLLGLVAIAIGLLVIAAGGKSKR